MYSSNKYYFIIWYDQYHVFKYDGLILNMVIIANMDTQHNILYLPSESNNVMSTYGKVSHLLIILLITVSIAPTAELLFFTTNTILLHVLSLFKKLLILLI